MNLDGPLETDVSEGGRTSPSPLHYTLPLPQVCFKNIYYLVDIIVIEGHNIYRWNWSGRGRHMVDGLQNCPG